MTKLEALQLEPVWPDPPEVAAVMESEKSNSEVKTENVEDPLTAASDYYDSDEEDEHYCESEFVSHVFSR